MPDILDDRVEIVLRRLKVPIGQNDKDEPDAIGLQRAKLVQNAIITKSGVISTRPGSTLVADDKGANAIDGLSHFNVEGGSNFQVMEANGTVYHRTAGNNWTTSKTGLTGGIPAVHIIAGKKLFRSNGIDNVFTWDGSTWTDEGNGNTDPPRFHFGIYHQNRLIVGRNDDSLVHFSDVLATQTFDRSANVHKPSDQDNGTGRALIELPLTTNNAFIYFKDNASYLFDSSSTTPADWKIVVVDLIHGLAATRAVVAIGSGPLQGGILYLSREGSETAVNRYLIRSIIKSGNDAVAPGRIVSNDLILNDINPSQVHKAVATFFNNKFMLAYASGSSSFNNKIVVLDLDVSIPDDQDYKWQEYTGWNAAIFATFIESSVEYLYFGEASADSIVLQAYNGTSDNGTSIVTKVTGRAEDGDFPEINKTWEFIEVFFRSTDDSLATVRVIFDDGTATELGTVNLLGSGPTLPINLPFNLSAAARIKAKFPLDTQISRTAQIEVEHSGSNNTKMDYLGYVLIGWAENLSFTD